MCTGSLIRPGYILWAYAFVPENSYAVALTARRFSVYDFMMKKTIILIFTLGFILAINNYTEAAEQYDVNTPHVIINQIYGAGDGGYVSHSFIELYNPTSDSVNMSGWSLQYRSSKDDAEYCEQWQKYTLSENTVIPSHSSLLVRCDQDTSGNADNEYRLNLSDKGSYDLSWDQRINTKGCAVALRSSDELIDPDGTVFDNDNNEPVIDDYVDMLAVSGNKYPEKPKQAVFWYEGGVEAVQSKKNGIRRVSFSDTDNNADDAEAINYSNADIDTVRPRSLSDGAWPEEEPINRTISFNRLSGFYDDEFALTMETDSRGTIYYTIDGSEPVPGNSNTYEYAEGIKIKDATENANIYAERLSVSAGNCLNYTDFINKGYLLPEYKIDKCTVIRAKAFYNDGTSTDTYTKSYFVGMKDRNSISNVNVISVTVEPEDLFDYESGIYVFGKSYDDNPMYRDWINGNYRNKGKEWERKATFDFYDNTGTLEYSHTGGIRIHGGGSRHYAFKSFNIYAREEYDGNKKFKYDFFGNGYNAKKLTLCTGSGDYISKSKDYLINLACYENGNYAVAHRIPYALFLNGEYWGMYYLTEKYDDKYIEFKYGVKDDNVVIIKNGSVEEGNEEDLKLWRDMRSYIINNDMGDESRYNKACGLIDIDSFIHYYATEIFVNNSDWPQNNYALWRVRDVGKGQYNDGRWRWLLFDVNYLYVMSSPSDDTISFAVNIDPVFKSLMRNRGFREKFAAVLSEVGRNYFSADKMSVLIDKYESDYLTALNVSYQRFYGKEKDPKIHQKLQSEKQFFNTRYDKIMGYMNYYLENPDALLKKYTVSFDSRGGSIVAKIFTDGGLITNAPQEPGREGYEFDGWFKESDCRTRWDFSRDTVNSNLTLYAGWKLIENNNPKELEEDPKSPEDKTEAPADEQKKQDTEPKVPLLSNSTYASPADNFAPVSEAKNTKKLALDFSNVDKSSVDADKLSMTVVKGSQLKTVDKVESVKTSNKKLKVNLNKKTGIAKVRANKSGSVTFNMQNGNSYVLSIKVDKPKAVKSAKRQKVNPGTVISMTVSDLFGTGIDSGTLSISSSKKQNQSEIKDNKLYIYPESKDRIKIKYSYLDKTYHTEIYVK